MTSLNHLFGRLKINSTVFVWVDCEMSGLDLKKDHILEIACILTDDKLNKIDEFGPLIVHQDEALMNSMDDWCTKTHGKSGLTKEVLASKISMKEAEASFLNFLKSHIKLPKTGYLAGNSVHADKAFLNKDMPLITDFLHYRIIDVSSIKVLCQSWYPMKMNSASRPVSKHRAMDDILGSIEELKWYRSNVFVRM
ncbi:Oligoribonuclease, mitochondrial [Coelomomyces lativittatus]|nr:Oligoribonuclease, mitochondrial [Coelomomyces lativittatus]KAJ1513051.1 Oligoribonuclease, mitochondrial [Coelomomyces lativittatus]KAJ1516017.1 Oligoribonuclease, mitochondrial [Coelomomyces lativittatus]